MAAYKRFVGALLAGIVGLGLTGTALSGTLTVVRAGSAAASGAVAGSVIDCGAICSGNVADGTPVTLTATAALGSQFTGWLGPCGGRRYCQFTINGATTVTAIFAAGDVDAFRLDVDGNAVFEPSKDGVLLARHLFGLTGTALTNGAIGAGATRTTPTQVESYLADIRPTLDIDGNGQVDALTDGLLMARYLLGLRGSSLISKAVGNGASRTDAFSIEAQIRPLTLPPVSLTQINTVDLAAGQDVYQPDAITVNRTTHKAYVAGGYSTKTYGVKVIDIATSTVVAGVDLGRYVIGTDKPRVIASYIAVDESAAPAGNRIYTVGFSGITNQSLRTVLRIIDGASNTLVGSQSPAIYLNIGIPEAIAVNSNNHKVYVIDSAGMVTIIDGPSATVLATFNSNVGPTPNALVVDPATNKVFAFGRSGAAIIDGTSDVATSLAVGFKTGNGVYNSANGRLYFLGADVNGTNGIYVLDSTGAVVATRTSGLSGIARTIAVDPSTNTVYVGSPTTNSSTGTVATFNATTLVPGSDLNVGSGNLAFDPANGGRILTLDHDFGTPTPALRNQLGIFNPATATLQNVTVGYRPKHLAVNVQTNRVYVADEQAAELVVLDGANQSVLARVATNPPDYVSGFTETVSRRHIAVSTVLDRVYLSRTGLDVNANSVASFVDIYDGTSRTLLQTLTINLGTVNLGVAGYLAVDETRRKLYVTGSDAGPSCNAACVAVYNMNDNSLITTILPSATFGGAGGIAVNPVTGRVYLNGGGLPNFDNVVIIDGVNNQVLTTLHAGAGPGPMAVNTATNKIYIANTAAGSVDNSVTVVDGATGAVEATISNTNTSLFGNSICSIAVDETSNTIYAGDCANDNDFHGRVSVFAGSNNSFLGQVDVGRFPRAMAFNAATGKLYVSNNEDGTVSVLAKP